MINPICTKMKRKTLDDMELGPYFKKIYSDKSRLVM
jgi:hypothetical protein